MEFKQEDRDMLIRHDIKLKLICVSIIDLKKEMRDGFKFIGDKLDTAALDCPKNRIECRKELEDKMTTTKKDMNTKIDTKIDWKLPVALVSILSLVLGFIRYLS